jgi:hypothetical protein
MMLAIAQRVGFDGPLTDLEFRPVWLAADGTEFYIAHGPADELGIAAPESDEVPTASAGVDLLIAVSSGAATFAAMGLAAPQIDA